MKLRNKKTGEIIDLSKRGLLKSDNDNHIIVYPEGTLKYYAYDSLAKLNEEWEDYKPAEPLIKDEKIRKAVRAWYKLFDESQLGQFKDGKYIAVGFREFVLQSLDESLTYTFELPFIDGMQTLKQRWGLDTDYYTIIELCGEEEE